MRVYKKAAPLFEKENGDGKNDRLNRRLLCWEREKYVKYCRGAYNWTWLSDHLSASHILGCQPRPTGWRETSVFPKYKHKHAHSVSFGLNTNIFDQ